MTLEDQGLSTSSSTHALRRALEVDGVATEAGDGEGSALSSVQDHFSFIDPAGHRDEIAWVSISDHAAFVSPTQVSGFVTEGIGLRPHCPAGARQFRRRNGILMVLAHVSSCRIPQGCGPGCAAILLLLHKLAGTSSRRPRRRGPLGNQGLRFDRRLGTVLVQAVLQSTCASVRLSSPKRGLIWAPLSGDKCVQQRPVRGWFESRKVAALAISSGSPKRGLAVCLRMSSRESASPVAIAFSTMIMPGWIALQRIFCLREPRGNMPGQRIDARLGCAIAYHRRATPPGCERGSLHDGTTAGLQHMWDCCTA